MGDADFESTSNKGAVDGYGSLDGSGRNEQPPLLHASEHTDGTDDIQDATDSQKGLATASQISKLNGIDPGADVTADNPPQSHDNTYHSTNYETEFSKNTAFNKDFGTGSGEVCEGNDSRLSDARTPTSHGNEAHDVTFITEVEGTDVKSTGETGGTKFLREDGDGTCSWQTPSGDDPDAIHDNEANEINSIAASLTPADTDVLIAEDADAGTAWSKAKLTMLNLYNYVKTKTDLLYAGISHDHSTGNGGAIATDQAAKFGDGGTTNYVEITTGGLIQLHGTAIIYKARQFYPYNMGGIAGTYNGVSCLAAGLGSLNGMYFKTFDDGQGAGQAEATNILFRLGPNYIDGEDITVILPMTVGGTSTNDVRWQCGSAKISEGDTFSPATYVWATPQNVAGPGTTWEKKDVTFTLDGTGLAAGDCISIVVFRDADNGADTYVGDAYLASICVRYPMEQVGE